MVERRPMSPKPEAPLYQTIYTVLREHLEAGAFPAGLVLGEANVARAFKASRIPAAAALKRLSDEGLIGSFAGRGFIARGGETAPKPLRLELSEAGLVLPAALEADGSPRNIGLKIYPEVEHAVAASLAYGRFMLNESALAEHYGVSRTIAHEVLTRLARTGIIVQEANQRWYAGPLTAESIREHYEMRWILEPVALRQAFPKFTEAELTARRDRVMRAQGGDRGIMELEGIEQDLHIDTVARCNNRQLLQAVQRSQLLLIATHATFRSHRTGTEISTMLEEHRNIYDLLLDGDLDSACRMLETHLHRSMHPNIEMIARLGPMPEAARLPYLTPVDRGAS
ncbi:GntR family transcriptional regulator [Devosia sp. LjRoot16]|uniref:GntR family transcriptional regulator n=1 Tax=Devosia sp. LjRoot16 TaxID=3342271 RepID=UPI003ECC4EB8